MSRGQLGQVVTVCSVPHSVHRIADVVSPPPPASPPSTRNYKPAHMCMHSRMHTYPHSPVPTWLLPSAAPGAAAASEEAALEPPPAATEAPVMVSAEPERGSPGVTWRPPAMPCADSTEAERPCKSQTRACVCVCVCLCARVCVLQQPVECAPVQEDSKPHLRSAGRGQRFKHHTKGCAGWQSPSTTPTAAQAGSVQAPHQRLHRLAVSKHHNNSCSGWQCSSTTPTAAQADRGHAPYQRSAQACRGEA